MSTVVMLVVMVLGAWAATMALRQRRSRPHPQVEWEHWLESSGMKPVIPRTRPVAEAVLALARRPIEVERAAMGRAGDGALLVVARLSDDSFVIAAQREGPVPDGAAQVLQGWQARHTDDPLNRAWRDARWLRNGPQLPHGENVTPLR